MKFNQNYSDSVECVIVHENEEQLQRCCQHEIPIDRYDCVRASVEGEVLDVRSSEEDRKQVNTTYENDT